MFSKACEYGIRATIYIASRSRQGERAGIKDICKEIGAPEHFTAKILQNLSRMKIISSVKGPNGGFYLDEGAKNIKLIDVVRAIDGDKLFTGCGLGIKECSETKPCPIHNEFKAIRNSLQQMLERTSLTDLTKDLEKGLVFLKR
ncbi:Rrf2 family transcriptional regulator [Fulvivirga kasyanovii]|uniref:Rrf2 family transcriptional regulator n=1 Tax=Fulvivirga kasyanovii TaxID=396812 RepID=A0ABW9RKB0_9BACT|nr:Rrf2 family transcriptional regulator [Fulvivirga kasyanovii]MTI24519.1 Rrf2 family transcriptional regulator [Fulvivirga kasyanovii]